ncbi:MAG: LytTR family DNA-binding domain-containing protein [Bacteroidota bacterium]
MIRTLIIDDEQNSQEVLKTMLKTYCPDLEVVGVASSPLEGIKRIQQLKPALVFLDVRMPGGTGFDVLEAFPERKFAVIFSTAYDQFAIQAIKARALDYLLKPINALELEQAVARIKEKPQAPPPKKSVEQLALPTLAGYTFVEIRDIIRVEGSGNYSTIYLNTGQTLTISKNIKFLEDRLQHTFFFRPHASHLINLQAIKRYLRKDGGVIEMQDGYSVPLSRRRKEQFQLLLKKWL